MAPNVEPVDVTLYGTSIFAGMIKLRILRWGDYPIQSACILFKRVAGDLSQTRRGEGSVTMEAEIGGMWPQAKECWKLRHWERQRADSPLEEVQP